MLITFLIWQSFWRGVKRNGLCFNDILKQSAARSIWPFFWCSSAASIKANEVESLNSWINPETFRIYSPLFKEVKQGPERTVIAEIVNIYRVQLKMKYTLVGFFRWVDSEMYKFNIFKLQQPERKVIEFKIVSCNNIMKKFFLVIFLFWGNLNFDSSRKK